MLELPLNRERTLAPAGEESHAAEISERRGKSFFLHFLVSSHEEVSLRIARPEANSAIARAAVGLPAPTLDWLCQ